MIHLAVELLLKIAYSERLNQPSQSERLLPNPEINECIISKWIYCRDNESPVSHADAKYELARRIRIMDKYCVHEHINKYIVMSIEHIDANFLALNNSCIWMMACQNNRKH